MTQVASSLLELGTSLFDSVLWVWFILRFNRVSLKAAKWAIPTVLLMFGITLIGDYLITENFTIISVALFLVAIAFSLSISWKHPFRAIMAGCVFEIAFILLSSLLYMSMSMLVKDFDTLLLGSIGAARLIYIFLHKLSLFTVLRLILHIFRSGEVMNVWNGILTSLLSLTTILGLGAVMTVAISPDAARYQTQILIVVLAFILVNVFLYVLLYQIQKLQKTRYELKLMEEKMAFEQARHNDAAAVWDNVRKVQHDMKQHLTVMSGYLEQKQHEQCREYIQELLPQVDQMGQLIRSGNTILDYLINSKLRPLENTHVIISGSIGDLSDIRDADLACLIGNILDNAIEATEQVEEKRIELLFSRQNANRVIICKNTVKESVLKHNRKLKSTKASGDAHGLGHQIVERIVLDYHGMIDYFEEYDMFGVQIILPVAEKDPQ
ncbi:MAG: GHKL domain-containing protein [Clostridia bacterium]|nr:GHKL domain-containing protein [Clostridia bacterium]